MAHVINGSRRFILNLILTRIEQEIKFNKFAKKRYIGLYVKKENVKAYKEIIYTLIIKKY